MPGFLFASVVKTYKNGNTFICLRLGTRHVMTIDTQKRTFRVVDALEIMKEGGNGEEYFDFSLVWNLDAS